MSVNAAMLDAMLAADLSREQIVALVKAAIAESDALAARKREVDAARKRRHREREDNVTRSHAESRGHDVTERDSSDTSSEPSSLSPPSFPPIPPITTPSDPSSGEITAREPAKRDGARSVLIAGGVEPENADALIELRKRKRAPLSPVMAEKLLKKMAKCRDGPNAAAEEMLAHGWQGFDASWLENRNGNGTSNSGNGRGHAAGKVDDLRDAIAIAKDIDDRRRESLLGDRQEPGGRAIGPR